MEYITSYTPQQNNNNNYNNNNIRMLSVDQIKRYKMKNSAMYKRFFLNTTFPSSTLTDYSNEHDIGYYKSRGYSYYSTLPYPSVDPDYENLYVVGYKIFTINGYRWYPVFNYNICFIRIKVNDEFTNSYNIYLSRALDRKRNKYYHRRIANYILQYEPASKINETLANLIADYWC